MSDLAAVVAELYDLAPGEFTAARNAAAAQAKKDGDAPLSALVRKLPRPSVGAWVVNRFARLCPEDVEELLSLGAALQQAQVDLDGDELRRLAADRTELLRRTVARAREVAQEADQEVSPAVATEVEQTLRAGLTDPEAGAAMASGRLVKALSAGGFGTVELDGAVAAGDELPPTVSQPPPWPASTQPRKDRPSPKPAAGRPDPAPKGTPSKDEDREQEKKRKQAEAARREAAERAQAAHAEAERAEADLSDTRAQIDEVGAELDRLTGQLNELRDRARELERQARDARKSAKDADRAKRTLRLID